MMRITGDGGSIYTHYGHVWQAYVDDDYKSSTAYLAQHHQLSLLSPRAIHLQATLLERLYHHCGYLPEKGIRNRSVNRVRKRKREVERGKRWADIVRDHVRFNVGRPWLHGHVIRVRRRRLKMPRRLESVEQRRARRCDGLANHHPEEK